MRKDRVPYSWTPMKYIKSQEDTIYLMKWQLKYNSYLPNNVKVCPLCGGHIYFWKHFIDCNHFKKFTQKNINLIQNEIARLEVDVDISLTYHKFLEDINWNFL